jgi:magnesium transporter
MTTEMRTWERLEHLIEQEDRASIELFLGELETGDRILALSRLEEEARSRLIDLLSSEDAADVLALLPSSQAAETLAVVSADRAAAVLTELPSSQRADLLGELPDDGAERILAAMDGEAAGALRALRAYSDEEAGGLMTTELVSLPVNARVSDIVAGLRERADVIQDLAVQYVYLVDDSRLAGVLPLRDLLLASGERLARDVMITSPLRVFDDAPVDELIAFFDDHAFLGVPVVDREDRLLGVVYRGALEEARRHRADRDLHRLQGIPVEELRSMPVGLRSRRRLAWLSGNIVLNVLAASVIAAFEDTLSRVIVLAVFLPIVSDMSGCSGNQAVAVSMRELSLGLVRPSEVVRVWGQELAVGLRNGLVLGLLIASGAWLWQGNPWLGAVVGAALSINTLVAVSVGGCLPLICQRWGLDPAIASGPVLTTVTDMSGFFLVLGLATLVLPHLS